VLGKTRPGEDHAPFRFYLGQRYCYLSAAGCDKCGDPVKFNVPGLPKSCYDSPRQK
jgi:hypothetical protein